MRRTLIAAAAAAVLGFAAAPGTAPAPVAIDYPAENSIFPPDMAPPTFLWRDPVKSNTAWRIDVTFADGSPALHLRSEGRPLSIGEIDERAVGPTNQPPKLTAEQAAAHTWTPGAETWTAVKTHSVHGAAKVTITGFSGSQSGRAVSAGRVNLRTSEDAVGAPIFYRDVPLMPSEVEKGVIKPLAPDAVPLIAWRLRNVSEPRSRLLMEGLHTCANCHSFSRDGRTLGMDMDGPKNDKGMYALVPISGRMSIRSQDVIEWSSFRGKLGGKIRVGFMSQVSPDGQYVVTMVNGPDVGRMDAAAPNSDPARRKPGQRQDLENNYYVSNFKNYRFLQVFYPTRGILSWYSRATGRLQPLPGADNPSFVQTNAVWSPDGRYLVFARAEARAPYPEGAKLAEFANDPNETPIQYDLYRIPFNNGKGGPPGPIAGASRNGMSNTFPKVSPDGRWIVFVQCRNGLLMRPDSQLYIVPAQGGKARRMRCNTPLMNSWHSFSPNGRWLVFSSKSRSPYTQMFLTHIDKDGNDSPPILIENATAANRAVNIPEFLNLPPDGLLTIDTPVTDFYRLADSAFDLTKKGRYDAAIEAWKKALELSPADDKAHSNLGLLLAGAGRFGEAVPHFEETLKINPEYPNGHSNLGVALAGGGKFDEAIAEFENALKIDAASLEAHNNLGRVLAGKGRLDEAVAHFQEALKAAPDSASVNNNLAIALGKQGKAEQAIAAFRKVQEIDAGYPDLHQNLGRLLADAGSFNQAMAQFELALQANPASAEVHNGLAVCLVRERRVEQAVAHFRKALEINPDFTEAHFNLGDTLYFLQGNAPEALLHWRQVLRIEPNHLAVLNQAAWVLATSPDESVRNGGEAVQLAGRAAQLSGGRNPAILDTLAAAWAEAGRFPDAVEITNRTLANAIARGDTRLAETLKTRLTLYQSETPFRDSGTISGAH